MQANSACNLFFCKHFSTPNVWCPKLCKILDTECSVSRIVNIFLHQTCSNQNRVHFCTLNTFCIQNLILLRLELLTPSLEAEAIPITYLNMHLRYTEIKFLQYANNHLKQLCVSCLMSSNLMSGILGINKCQLLIDRQHFLQKFIRGH